MQDLRPYNYNIGTLPMIWKIMNGTLQYDWTSSGSSRPVFMYGTDGLRVGYISANAQQIDNVTT